MIHRDIKAAPAAGLGASSLAGIEPVIGWSRTPGACAAACSQTGPGRSGLRGMNASAAHNLSSWCLMAWNSTGRLTSMMGAVPQSGSRR